MADPFAKNAATTAEDALKIIPRAEFRTFGQGVIELVKEKMWNGKTVLFQARRMPMETYFLSTILSHLQAQMDLTQDMYTIDEFIAMARKHADLVPVTVEKMRYGFTIDGIICEYAQVWFNGAMVETACAESENYAGMRQVIEGLGIAAMPNTNYLKAAKKVMGME